jgi:uncharacterized surface protein with fasciclin (FAS1) repeats
VVQTSNGDLKMKKALIVTSVMTFATLGAVMAPVASAGETYATTSAATEAPHAAGDIVDVAVANGNFKTLADLLGKAGLVETLKGKGPFTVFAPTDEAFAKLPKETLDSLVLPENAAKLKSILTYHVVAKKITAADIAGKKLDVKTVEGEKITVDATSGTVKVNNATVTTADVAASNGVIHVIDTVLLPK